MQINEEELVDDIKRFVSENVSLSKISDEELAERIDQIVTDRLKDIYCPIETKVSISQQVYSSIRGFGLLDSIISDDSITEVMINGPEKIFIEKKGRLTRLDKKFESQRKLEDVIQRIVGLAGREVNQANPICDTRLPDGSRVNVVLPPIALCGPTITIRKFSKEPMTINKLIEYGSITQEIADKLELLVKAKYNIFISGGTGSGKTTFLNALSNFIPKDERIITIEDSAELQIAGIDNLVSLETRNANASGAGQITIRDLIKSSLRMRPERIIVGECRGGEALDMLQAMNTGHDGSLSTGHAKPMQPAMNQLKNEQVQTNMPSQGKMQSQRETQSANNVVQPNQVNFAVPNMNPQNQNRINNNVQMGTNISGTYVETTSEKQMSMFGLLTHYSKENKQIYERQKAQRKAQKEAEKNGAAMPGQNVKPSNVSFAIPGQPPQQRPQPAQAQPQPVMPQLPQQQFAQPQRQFTQSNQPQRQFAQPQPMPQAQQKPAQQVQPQSVQNQNTNTGMTGNPSVPPQILENMTKAGNFGETTVLGVGSEAGETTVLGTSQAQIIKPYLLRIKNNERIELNKPVFRIGKERSYVDYFVSDNTAVSRSHANIINKDNEFYIVDTNSTNHTYVNGSMIQSNVETKIEHGTKIRLANEDFEFFMY